MLAKAILTLTLAFSSIVFAESEADIAARVEEAHAEVLVSKKVSSLKKFAKADAGGMKGVLRAFGRPSIDCNDEDNGDDGAGSSCVDFSCKKLGSFGCDEMKELKEVGQACRGTGGACMEKVCEKLGSFGCDQISEITEVAKICRGNRGSCFTEVCGKLGSFGCDQVSETRAVGEMCRGVQSKCVTQICSRLGSFGCDSMNELQEVAKSCRGH